MLGLLGGPCGVGPVEAIEVEPYKTLELVFDQAAGTPANPFDTYLLRLEVTDPGGRTFQLDGFYDGNGQGGQSGNIWKARICPYQEGTWSWRTVTGDAADAGLAGLGGQFHVATGNDHGGITADGRYFQFQDGSPTYLVGNFLDFTGGLKSTHVYVSTHVPGEQRGQRRRYGSLRPGRIVASLSGLQHRRLVRHELVRHRARSPVVQPA